MPLEDLLVHLDDSTQSVRRLDYVLGLAERHGAHVTGLYTLDLAEERAELARVYLAEPIAHFEHSADKRKAALTRASETEAHFRDNLQRRNIAGEWRFGEGLPAEIAVLHARYADLAVVGQVDPERHYSENAGRVPEVVLLGSGRPVLVVPYVGDFRTYGEHVVVAWNPTREAARAIADALPILERARKVTVLSVNPERITDPEPGIPTFDIAHHLARHGVSVESATAITDGVTTADTLLNYVSDCGADLLAMGGYGHSRAREALFGGVTRTILSQMTVPVLMAH